MRRKVLTLGLAVLLALSLAGAALAHGGHGLRGGSCTGLWGTGSGVCAGVCTDADGDGVCDRCGLTCPAGAGWCYTDADGDGVCDHYGTGSCVGGGLGHRGHHGGR